MFQESKGFGLFIFLVLFWIAVMVLAFVTAHPPI